MKLVREEPESASLAEAVSRSTGPPIASALVRVELRRAATRVQGGGAPSDVQRVEAVLRSLDLIVLDDALLDDAGRLDAPGLRSLDAIHVASARLVGDDLAALVTYDRRMLDAAAELRLPVSAPGA